MDEHFDGHALLARARELPGGRELIDLARTRADVALVGGAVRDLLLNRIPRELDVVVGDAHHDATNAPPTFGDTARLFADELSSRLNAHAETNAYERFGTVLVRWDGGRVDIASRRAESYAAPGALPDVRAGTPEEDLLRRDFTVNAIAVALNGDRPGQLHTAPDALADLHAGRLRVLHDASFSDDPTRLLRLARYAARLGFEIEPHTAELAARAVASRALDTVSGARLGAELRLALSEPDVLGTLAAMNELDLLTAIHPRLQLDRAAIERALMLLEDAGRPDLLMVAALVLPLTLRAGEDPRAEIVALLDRLEFSAPERDRIAAAAVAVPRLMDELPAAQRSSQLWAAVSGTPPEGIALAGSLASGADTTGATDGEASTRSPAWLAARRWFEDVSNTRLYITGEDLIAAGIPEGPEIGRRLERVLELRLDGELAGGREAELQAALGT
jgi:tRNA nucleotidyltransferase (CCA-adding enzyme)